MSEKRALVSVKIADGLDGVPIQSLMRDLAGMVHEEAASYYGVRTNDCHHHGFSGETGGRAEFEAALIEDLHLDSAAARPYLAEWDAASRPVAVVHYWLVPVPS